MDLKTYYRRLNNAERAKFLLKAKTSQGFINNVIGGKTVSSCLKIALIVDASDGVISVKSLNPEIFPKTKAGRKRLQSLINALSDYEQAA